MSGFKIQRLKKGDKLSASNWNAMADRLEALLNLGVSYPLTMSNGPSGVLLASQDAGIGGVIAKAKLQSGTWCDIKDWSEATVGSNQQQTVWDFQLPKTAKFTEAAGSKNNWMSTSDWDGSDEYVRAFCLSRQYVPKNVFVQLFKSGSDGQYYFDYHMPPVIYGTLDADLNQATGNALMTIDAGFAGEFQGTKIRIYDKMLNTGKKIVSGTPVWAGLARHSGTGTDPFCWKYYLLQAKACPT